MSIWGSETKHWAVALVAAAALAGSTRTSAARQASREELEDRIRRLEQIIRDAGLDQPAARKAVRSSANTGGRPATAAADAAAPNKEEVEALVEEKLRKQKVLAGWKDGFFLESPNGDFKLKLRGYLQADARFFPLESGDTGTDSMFLRRVRPIVEGTVYKYFDFKIMPDFGQGSTVLQDAYARINYWPYAQIQAGKWKSPFSLERLQGGDNLTFIERSIANNLAPNRDIGVALGGGVLADRINYQVGVFNGSGDGQLNDGATVSDKTFEGRVFVEPFKVDGPAPVRGLGFGIGSTYGSAKDASANGLAYKTAGRSNFFKFNTPTGTAVNNDGTTIRFAPQAYWYWGPFGLMGEYIDNDEELQQVVTPKTGAPTLTDTHFKPSGWFLQASYVLTGEDASYKQVVPINNFDPVNNRWGAFEAAFRVSEVDIEDDIFRDGFAKRTGATSSATAYTGGLNWYFNKNFKFQINWEHTEFDNNITYGDHTRNHEDVFLSRFQIAY